MRLYRRKVFFKSLQEKIRIFSFSAQKSYSFVKKGNITFSCDIAFFLYPALTGMLLSIFSINIPYPMQGSFIITCVTIFRFASSQVCFANVALRRACRSAKWGCRSRVWSIKDNTFLQKVHRKRGGYSFSNPYFLAMLCA